MRNMYIRATELFLDAVPYWGLYKLMGFFGSLTGSEDEWKDVARNVDLGKSDKALALIDRIIEKAVPHEEFPHPQRATADADDVSVWVQTPGGVRISFYPHPTAAPGVNMHIVFGRESKYTATGIVGEYVAMARRIPYGR